MKPLAGMCIASPMAKNMMLNFFSILTNIGIYHGRLLDLCICPQFIIVININFILIAQPWCHLHARVHTHTHVRAQGITKQRATHRKTWFHCTERSQTPESTFKL